MALKVEGVSTEELCKLEDALKEKGFSQSLESQASVSDVQRVLATRGIHFTMDEVVKIRETINNMVRCAPEGELSEDELEDVAGGLFDNWKIYLIW